jgi:hypothetical protein
MPRELPRVRRSSWWVMPQDLAASGPEATVAAAVWSPASAAVTERTCS